LRDVKDRVRWTVLHGREPAVPGEIMVGSRTAQRLGVGVGDRVESTPGAGPATSLAVVGVGIGPPVFDERLGAGALIAPEDLARLGRAAGFVEALIRVAPGADRAGVVDEYAAQLEVIRAAPPRDVQNLIELGRLPEALGAFLALVASFALGHALVATTRRRAGDLAVLRTIGFTTRQVRVGIAAMALGTVTAGLVLGIPLGLAVGRLVWWAVADATGVATDADPALGAIGLLVPAALVVSVVIAWWPARLAARRAPARVLRAE
jgi:hypothetical protein